MCLNQLPEIKIEYIVGPGFPGILAFLAAGEDRGDLRLGRSLVAGIKNTTADFLVDGIVTVGVALNEPHFARVPLVNLACQGRVVSSASHGDRKSTRLNSSHAR